MEVEEPRARQEGDERMANKGGERGHAKARAVEAVRVL